MCEEGGAWAQKRYLANSRGGGLQVCVAWMGTAGGELKEVGRLVYVTSIGRKTVASIECRSPFNAEHKLESSTEKWSPLCTNFMHLYRIYIAFAFICIM